MNWFRKSSGTQKVKGSPETICKYVYNDIYAVKKEIRQLNELTGILNSKGLFSKLYNLLEHEHSNEYQVLKKKYGYENTQSYYSELLSTYKRHLQDYVDLLEISKNNHNNKLCKENMQSRRSSSDTGLRASSCLESVCSKEEVNEIINNEAPEHFLDPISFNLFSDPVITPCGITYERTTLLEHLNKRGEYDPLTRVPVKASQVYSNLAIKESVLEYMNNKEKEICTPMVKSN